MQLSKSKQKKKKKILFVIQSLKIGGAERAQVTLANLLVEKGYDVTILMWLNKNDYSADIDPRVRVIYKPGDQHLGNKIPYIRYKFFDGSMWAERATPRQFYRYYVGREKYDVEIAFFHTWAVKIIAGSTNKKAVRLAWVHHDFRNLEELDDSQIEEYNSLYRKFHKVVCVSYSSLDGFKEAIGDTKNLVTIHNILPIEEIRRKAKEEPRVKIETDKFHVVQVARFAQVKGYERLIRVVCHLRHEGYHISLALVGAGEIDLVKAAVKEYHAGSFVKVIEGKNNPFPYIRQADLLVCASYTEGYNLTVAEALILDTPVLSTDCTGPNEVLDHGRFGMLVENSENGLYLGLKYLYQEPPLVEYYKKQARERMDFFDEEKLLKKITDLFEG